MKKFLVLYHSAASNSEQMKRATPEQMKAVMEAWMAWAKACGPALLDMGAPLGHGRRLTPATIDESQREVTGYSLLQADSLDAALSLMKTHPHLQTPGKVSIEVHEALSPPGR